MTTPLSQSPTDNELVTMLRRHRGADEPAFTLSAHRVLVEGRRHLRVRRTSLALRGAAAVVVVLCVAAPAPADGMGPEPSSARAPSTTTLTAP